jgi:hypothetical protein
VCVWIKGAPCFVFVCVCVCVDQGSSLLCVCVFVCVCGSRELPAPFSLLPSPFSLYLLATYIPVANESQGAGWSHCAGARTSPLSAQTLPMSGLRPWTSPLSAGAGARVALVAQTEAGAGVALMDRSGAGRLARGARLWAKRHARTALKFSSCTKKAQEQRLDQATLSSSLGSARLLRGA